MQKVARLKAAAARGKAAQVSTFDKVIVVGRRVADTAHKVTALSLIAFSGNEISAWCERPHTNTLLAVTGAVTIYALGDMIIYNRRKRREYYAEQKALHSSALFEAQKAIQAGHATEAQHAIVEEEFKYMQEVKAQANKPGVWARGKEWLFSGMKKENTGEISDELVKQAVEDSTETINIPEPISSYNGTSEMLKAVDNKKDDIQSRAKSAFDKERELQKIGGPLDRLGTAPEGPYAEGGQYADGKSKGSGGWTSFMTRK